MNTAKPPRRQTTAHITHHIIPINTMTEQKSETPTNKNARARRGKRNHPPTTSPVNKTENVSSSSGKFSTSQEVSSAMDRIIAVRARTAELYVQWKSQLLRLSFLVAIMAVYQSNKAVQQCIIEVKSMGSGNDSTTTTTIPLIHELHRVLHNFKLEVLNVLLAISLFMTLSQTMNDVNSNVISLSSTWAWVFHWTFLTSTTLTAAMIGLYLFTGKIRCDALMDREQVENITVARQDFPLSAVFYVIVTGVYVFISMGLNKVNRNLILVRTLQKQLEEGEKLREKGIKAPEQDGKKKKN